MPGMRSGLNLYNPVLAAAFRSALLHQGFIALLIFAVLALAWVAIREWRPVAAGGGAGSSATPARAGGSRLADPEPSWRMLLRVGFGIIALCPGCVLFLGPAGLAGGPGLTLVLWITTDQGMT